MSQPRLLYDINTLHPPAAGPVGGWVELGRTSSATPITVSSLADKRYYLLLNHVIDNGSAIDVDLRINNISTGDYAYRESDDGTTDVTNVDQTEITLDDVITATERFSVNYVSNFATKEKLLLSHLIGASAAGADTAPSRVQTVGKWDDVSNAIDRFDIIDTQAGDYTTDSELVVLAWDPDDTHTTNFWEELATDTLTGTDGNVQLTVTAKKYLWIQAYMIATSTLVPWLRFNNVSTGDTYSFRKSDDGGTEGTSVDQNQMVIGLSASYPQFVNIFVVNRSANEKLVICHSVGRGGTPAAQPVFRRETVAKSENTSTSITEVDFVSSTSTFASGSEFKVWGSN